MRKLLLLLSFCGFFFTVCSQPASYWQQQLHYTIDVSLNDREHTLDGFEKISYTNHSPDTLSFIWFHLWPNAYKNDQTAFSDQLLENGSTQFYFSTKEQKGYINQLNFKADNILAETEDHPHHIDIVKVLLPVPLAPGKTTVLTTSFHVKLPHNFSRGGHIGQSYQLTQWYPKPAVYDSKGWHPMPYLDQGEFYSEFGTYDVSITLPANYAVAATGELQDEAEKKWLASRSNFYWEPIKEKKKTKSGSYKVITQEFPTSASTTKTLRFVQADVHDFAWFADKRFIVATDTVLLASGKKIDVFSYYTPAEKEYWNNSTGYVKDALRTRSEWIGEYPYSTASVVQAPAGYSGGMEYPTITLVEAMRDKKLLDYTIAHEISHNWFYGILGSNERQYPWLDEGLNTYYDNRYSEWKYNGKEITAAGNSTSIKKVERLAFESAAAIKKDQPINTGSEALTASNYSLTAYYKTGAWLEYAETVLGKAVLDKSIREYYRRWKFKHPQPEDLQQVMEETSGQKLDSLFSLLEKKGILPNQARKGTQFFFLPNIHSLGRYINAPSKNVLLVGPAIGTNKYDKFMIGAMLTNMKQPPVPFQFLLVPMYATGSKRFTGTGLASYSFFPGNKLEKIDIGISAAAFSINKFTDAEKNTSYQGFHKLVPGLRLTLKEKNPRSTLHRYVQFKSFFISEEGLRFFRDTVVTGIDTTITDRYRTESASRTLHQLKMVIENYRVLYPYSAELKLEQGTDFVRAAFTGKYFFNYANGGGLDLRFFAGKFFYTSPRTFTKQFATDRYHLNMTGANGYEDYTYADYFVGRNEFEGAASQQIMVRDGAFKIRTDLLAQKVGRTDNWLAAFNFSTTIPNGINPLSLLPIKIPLKVFVDIGTYAEAWQRDANTDRFLFDAGLHIPLLKETVNIYVPLIYSPVFKDYLQSTLPKKNRLWKTISFSIDISNFNFRKLNRNFFF